MEVERIAQVGKKQTREGKWWERKGSVHLLVNEPFFSIF